jgi:hypothetical protein
MDAEMLDALGLFASEDGHDDQGVTRAVEESDFVSSLENELSILGLVAERKGWLLCGKEIVSAHDFVNLSGESEVFEELNVEKIVELALNEGQDMPDSDENRDVQLHIVQTSIGQVIEYACQLQEFVDYHPDSFSPHLVSAVNDIRRKLNAMQLTSLRQTSITDLFQAS